MPQSTALHTTPSAGDENIARPFDVAMDDETTVGHLDAGKHGKQARRLPRPEGVIPTT